MKSTYSIITKVIFIAVAAVIVIAAAIVGFYAHNQSAAASEYNQTIENNYYKFISDVRDISDNVNLEKASITRLDSKITDLKNLKDNIDVNSLTYYDSSSNLVDSANDYISEIIDEFKDTLSTKIDDAIDKYKITNIDSETKESLQEKIDGLTALKETLSSVSNVNTTKANASIDKIITQATEKQAALEGTTTQSDSNNNEEGSDNSTASSGSYTRYNAYSSGGAATSYSAEDTADVATDTSAGYADDQNQQDVDAGSQGLPEESPSQPEEQPAQEASQDLEG